MILVSGICGFVGSSLARALRDHAPARPLAGFDNFIRPGSETNRSALRRLGIQILHADLRNREDIDALPAADWVIDCAANPSVLAGVDGASSSRAVLEHNLVGTINLLEYCKRHRAGFILLSTSRVYSIPPLAALQTEVIAGGKDRALDGPMFWPAAAGAFPEGLSAQGVAESFSTAPPVSLYGATKLASELIALEYADAFGFPAWINRCGVMAGAGQFGRADQGIFAFWINSWLRKAPLKYIGFGGSGHQVRDCLHPRDLVPLLEAQMSEPPRSNKPRIVNVSGGAASAVSLAQLSAWCEVRFGPHPAFPPGGGAPAEPRPFDIPWMVLDPSLAGSVWGWKPATRVTDILEEIARHGEENPGWLDLSAP